MSLKKSRLVQNEYALEGVHGTAVHMRSHDSTAITWLVDHRTKIWRAVLVVDSNAWLQQTRFCCQCFDHCMSFLCIGFVWASACILQTVLVRCENLRCILVDLYIYIDLSISVSWSPALRFQNLRPFKVDSYSIQTVMLWLKTVSTLNLWNGLFVSVLDFYRITCRHYLQGVSQS